MGGDKRFKARWTDNFGGETTNVNKSLSPPHDLRIMMVSHGRTASDNIKQRRARTFHRYPKNNCKKALTDIGIYSYIYSR